jgi:hypothetical protein
MKTNFLNSLIGIFSLLMTDICTAELQMLEADSVTRLGGLSYQLDTFDEQQFCNLTFQKIEFAESKKTGEFKYDPSTLNSVCRDPEFAKCTNQQILDPLEITDRKTKENIVTICQQEK